MRLSTVNIQTQTAFDLFDLHIIYMDFRSNEFNLLWFLISCVWHSLPQVQTNVGWNPFWPTTSMFNNYSNYSTTGHEISSNKLQCCSFLIAMILCPVRIRVIKCSKSTSSYCYTFISYDSPVEEQLYWRTGLIKAPWPFTRHLLVVFSTTFKVNAASIMLIISLKLMFWQVVKVNLRKPATSLIFFYLKIMVKCFCFFLP